MKYFLDNTFPKRLAAILRLMGVDATHLQDEFASETPDVTWLSAISGRECVVLTGDGRIRKGSAERMALEQSRVPTLYFFAEFPRRDVWQQVSFVIEHWPEIDKEASRMRSGETRYLNARCKITTYEDLAARRRK